MYGRWQITACCQRSWALTVVLPDELLSNDDGVIERDRIADVSVLAAVDVWMHLRNWRFVPDRIQWTPCVDVRRAWTAAWQLPSIDGKRTGKHAEKEVSPR
jgi:hypothetical protein